ncbi:putative RTA1 domain protein [Glonium stellatum]|uniref:Putative RTA1 domain protein n=1 Tax=Glonium stellatum TaxID=574774 RepID=A0A8E2ERH4_9PEZI|nr:putative RTA1 domain protein [Glonium stellatum]
MGLIANPVIPDAQCTLQSCSLLQAHYQYLPSLAGNALYVGIFGLLLAFQIIFGWRARTWGFLGGMFGGLVLEVIGYIGRIQMHSNPFIDGPFLMSLVTLTIAPAFLSASIYLCLSRIVVVYGEDLSRFRPRTYTLTFITCDFISLVLQAAGGAIASGANTPSQTQMGINIMIAGLSFQVFSLALFMVLTAEFAWRVSRSPARLNASFERLRETRIFTAFLGCLGLATLCIFIRSCFRVAELSGGFHGALANQQVTFMILEGAMIIVAVGALTACHPLFAFQGRWADAGWSLRGNVVSGKVMSVESLGQGELELGRVAGLSYERRSQIEDEEVRKSLRSQGT